MPKLQAMINATVQVDMYLINIWTMNILGMRENRELYGSAVGRFLRGPGLNLGDTYVSNFGSTGSSQGKSNDLALQISCPNEILMATNLSFGDASSLLHQLENELTRDKPQPSMPHPQGQQRPGSSSSDPLPSMASSTVHFRPSQPAMSMLGKRHPILPPLNATPTSNAKFPSTYPISHERWGGDRECLESSKSTPQNTSIPLPPCRAQSSPSPRRRTPPAMGRVSSGNSRVEGKGRISKVQRTEKPNAGEGSMEERSWFDADGDGKRNEELKELPKLPTLEIKRKEVPYRVQPPLAYKQPPTTTPIFGLEDQVADILSTFESTPNTPSSFSNLASEFQNPLEDIHLSTILISSTTPSLPATVYSLAVSNPSFFQTLREAVPPEYCAISFFKRIEAQVYAIGRRHSDYLFSGASFFDLTGMGGRLSGPGRTLAEDEEMCLPDAKWCETALKRRVSTIRRHLEMRKPLGRGAKEQAMRALVRILWEVTDKGVYEEREDMGAGMSSTPMDPQKRQSRLPNQKIGVYGRLIGKTGASISVSRKSGGFMYGAQQMQFAWPSLPPSAAPEGFEGGYFVIEALWELMDCAGPSMDLLRMLLERIKMFEARDGYIEELERFLVEAGKQNSQMGAGGDVNMGDQVNVALSRKSSVDSAKRARECSEEEPRAAPPRISATGGITERLHHVVVFQPPPFSWATSGFPALETSDTYGLHSQPSKTTSLLKGSLQCRGNESIGHPLGNHIDIKGEREKEPPELEGGRGSVHGSEFMQPELMNIQRRPDLMNVDVVGKREIGVDQLASITESPRTGVPNSAQVQQQELPRTVLPADKGLSQRGFTRADTITRLVLEGEIQS
ncbi:hypothetical protein BGX38DRAFT_1258772 [Terfezia claveryi]|nr:hypothetical protein BGX38DRAFT_1258772 [Terfezia claveryi]